MDLIKLDVLVCTTASRLSGIDISGWPEVDGVRYVISCQNPRKEVLSPPVRRDIFFTEDITVGLSANRNHAISVSSAPVFLIADDDTFFYAAGLEGIISVYEADAALDYATFRATTCEARVFPSDGYDLGKDYRYYFPISLEITFRRQSYMRAGLSFSLLAGVGAPYLCAGEEDLLLYHARKAGLKGRFFDILIVNHPQQSTSERLSSEPAFIRTKGALMQKKRSFLGGILRIPLEAVRAPIPFLHAFRYLTEGYIYSIRNNRLL